MVRHPLFRDEDKAMQSARLVPVAIPSHTAGDQEIHQKASPGDALWNRMNQAMRVSCQPTKPPMKR